MRSRIRVHMVCLIVLVAMGLAGCGVWPVMTNGGGKRPYAMGKSDQVIWPGTPSPKHLNEDFGLAYRQAVEAQILNPEAGNSLTPVVGIDGQSSEVNIIRFRKMFEEPPFAANASGGGGTIIFGSGGN